jgi:hypothetical protein
MSYFTKRIVFSSFLLLFSVIFSTSLSFAQASFTISGKITDAKNGEGMIGVNVFIKELKIPLV